MHPRDRLKYKTKNRKNIQNVLNAYEDERLAKNSDVQFIKKVLLHLRDRLARKTQNEVEFIKKVPLHPHDILKHKTKKKKKYTKRFQCLQR